MNFGVLEDVNEIKTLYPTLSVNSSALKKVKWHAGSKKNCGATDLSEDAEEDGGTERDAKVCCICMSMHVCLL